MSEPAAARYAEVGSDADSKTMTTPETIDPRLDLSPADEHNRRLVDSVHPAAWRNPTPPRRYNLVAIGGGTAGLVAAAGAAGMGARVALVERHLLGGDCLNVGCVPSKTILRAARAAVDVRDASRFGVRTAADPAIDFTHVMERVRRVRADIAPHDSAARFTEHYGVDVYLGDARFTGRDVVEVGGSRLRFAKAVIATGARARIPPIPGLAESGYLTNATVFNLTELPPRLAVIGGGPIGCELAQAFARLGSAVTLVEMADQLLPREDHKAAELLCNALRRDGVTIRLGSALAGVERRGSAKVLAIGTPSGLQTVVVDQLLIAVGRTPNVEGLDLDAAGVAVDRDGVRVDDSLRTTNRRIYASGDVCLAAKFTHTADAASRAVLQNALFPGPRKRVSRMVVPWCTYTDPEIAHVGLTEQDAHEGGLDVDTITIPMSDVDRAIAEGEEEGFITIRLERGKDRILGADIVSRHAGELISELTTAMVGGIGLGSFGGIIHPYPTRAEAIRKAADAFNRTRLTPRTQKLLGLWFRWTR
jgi:pyruvate/2-oxoglutarate dehydrogenase complex dihydrolipoamide dehydrogenase (E3) component